MIRTAPTWRGGTRIEAYWRTLHLDFSLEPAVGGGSKPASSKDRLMHDQWWFEQLLIQHNVSHKIRTTKTANINVEVRIQHCTSGRRFFITDSGYFGLGHGGVRVGDHVCVLAGGK